jgi:hypothetical protein
LSTTAPIDPRLLISDILLLVILANPSVSRPDGRMQPAEHLVPTDAGLLGFAAGPDPRPGADPHDLLVAACLGPEQDIVFLAAAKVSGEAELLRFEDGPWLTVVRDMGAALRGDVPTEAGWFAPSSLAVH